MNYNKSGIIRVFGRFIVILFHQKKRMQKKEIQ